MAYLIDTNILVRREDAQSIDQPLAITALHRLWQRGEILHIATQNIVEFWAVATRPRSVNGLGMLTVDAELARRRLELLMPLLPDQSTVYSQWVRLVNQYSVSGKPTHDARLVATMIENGLTHILTFNDTDFIRYSPTITVVHPKNV